MDALQKKAVEFIKSKKLLTVGDKVLIALSGGADSVFLMHLLIAISAMYKLSLACAHLNHSFRGAESDEDENYCRSLAVNNGLPYYSKRIDVAAFALDHNLSDEEAGRICRYAWLEELMEQISFNKIATGHHLSDNAETILFHIMRGSGLRGAAGIPVQRGNIIRPLLGLTSAEIRESLTGKKIDWREDSSNASSDFTRNVIRNEIFPLIISRVAPNVEESLIRHAFLMGELLDYLNTLTASFLASVALSEDSETIYNKGVLDVMPRVVRMHAINQVIERAGVESSFSLVEDLNRIVESGKSGVYQIGNGYSIFCSEAAFICFKDIEKDTQIQSIPVNSSVLTGRHRVWFEEAFPQDVTYHGVPTTEFLGTDHPVSILTLRCWKDGDSFQPLGMNGKMLVSDFLNGLKIPQYKKPMEKVLVDNKVVVAVLGRRISDLYKVTGSKKFIYRIKIDER